MSTPVQVKSQEVHTEFVPEFPEVFDGRTYIKVNLKTLASEASHIRKERSKAKSRKQARLADSLQAHRRGTVRDHARSSLMAYQFFRGVPLSKFEQENGNQTEQMRALIQAKTTILKYCVPLELNPDFPSKLIKDYKHIVEARFSIWAGWRNGCPCNLCKTLVK